MEIGVVLNYNETVDELFRWCAENEIPTCQLSVRPELQTQETAASIKKWCGVYGMRITALVGAWTGPNEWNFTKGPFTLGIIPPAYRAMRMAELESCARFAQMLGVGDICTHLGFIPECPCDSLYADFIAALRYLLQYYKDMGIRLNMETGQETPVTLLRVINDVQSDNIGINFDPANLLMYGKANPIDALSIIGKYVNGVHAKDGEYPTDGVSLGEEKPLGAGRVNIPLFVETLHNLGYTGALTIEREISGERQRRDIVAAKDLLRKLVASLRS
ncbi:MAG: sugar phosphate isomerase/epimerase [Defluviitaleaceae bacterium]|nr:sugar phosphate isomerase/epimerase [Defluviitaleaceae bacterium]MCL2835321.1 sugar phosphate isomerase/epimerase [Defluviitaleaceae bacterium]